MCLKILPVLPDLVCIPLESMFSLPGWATFPFFVKDDLFSLRCPFWTLPVFTQLVMVTVIFCSGHIFPEIPGRFVTVTFLVS